MEQAGQFLIGLLALIIGALLTVWVVWKSIKKADDPGRVFYKWIISGVIFVILVFVASRIGGMGYAGAFVGPIVAAAFGVVLGILWAPHLGALIAKPFTAFYDGGETEIELRPLYSIARAKQKRGLYLEALAETQKQLERFSTDFEGWMLQAEIYAQDLKNHEDAQRCISEILSHKGHAPRNIVYALNRSADWHLQFALDRDAAREALQEILRRFPGSEFAHTAAQQVAHLSPENVLSERKDASTIRLEHHDEHIGLEGRVADPRRPEEEPAAAASRLVQHLKDYPEDVEAREQLAAIYADHYARTDLAADQIEQLIGLPGATQKEIARWLNMLVDFHVRVGQDKLAARAALERIMALYPKAAVASLAESRLAYLEGEFRKSSKSQVFKLGSYEENIGLKGKVPKPPTPIE